MSTELESPLLCEHCGQPIENPTENETLNQMHEVCFEENYSTCDSCGNVQSTDNMTWIEAEGVMICSSCFDRHFTTCDDCNENIRTNNSITAHNSRGREITLCSTCAHDSGNYLQCEDCDNLYHNNFIRNLSDRYICEHCLGDRYRYCNDCEEYYNSNDYDNCPNCEDNENHNKYIQSYDYKPKAIL